MLVNELLLAFFSKGDPFFNLREIVSNLPVFLNKATVLSSSRGLGTKPAPCSLQQTYLRVQVIMPIEANSLRISNGAALETRYYYYYY